jgi:hypothetical protein
VQACGLALSARPGREMHLHLNVTPDQLAAIVRYSIEEK